MLSFVVPGQPVPTARARVVVRGGKAHAFTPKRTASYQTTVALYARRAMALRAQGSFPMKGALGLHVQFHREDERRCDLDNLAKGVKDALTKVGAWGDDSQVVHLEAFKFTGSGDPRTEVRVFYADRAGVT